MRDVCVECGTVYDAADPDVAGTCVHDTLCRDCWQGCRRNACRDCHQEEA